MKMRWVLAGMAALAAMPAHAQETPPESRGVVDVAPYIEVGQVVVAELSPDDEVLTYTELAAGIDASIQRKNVEGQVSYRYERRIAWNDDFGDDEVHSGLARAAVGVGRSLTIEGGALATRVRSGIGGQTPFDIAPRDDVTNLYALYAGPSFAERYGNLDVSAGYRFAYTKVEAPDAIEPGVDYYDDATIHVAQGSIGMGSRGSDLPFGWTISGAYTREDAGQLDARYEGWFARGDVVVPLSPALAAVGGVGWEQIDVSQKAPLLDEDGDPVIDDDGRFVTDPGSPRLVAYAEDALYWDVGVMWRPSPRTSLEARVGERYGSFSFTGSLQWQAGRRTALQIGVYDSVDSFGRRLTDDLAGLPTRFRSANNSFTGGFSGCVFGTGEGQAGGCLTNALAAISTANYRVRGIDAVLSSGHGLWSYGVGAGYAHRDYYAPDLGPGVTVFGVEDESAYLQAYVDRRLSPNSSVDGQFYATWYGSNFAQSDVFSTGAVGTYNYSFGRFDALGSLGIQSFEQDGFEDSTVASARLGMRYNF
ncbi:hypothetical protein D1610_11425 [Sphingomonas gilva]|uniref:Preprotein translocase subunit YajC n=1 Tax=Sphingomonas gilva TaxID=2305907 RepID=A0A396RS53_9SPHN|nr:hypothetical protein [Sphingomonas gilva]RHW17153.1 hypothetical protein D1610_11425 [Sphingomonas gilva]